MQLKIKRFRFNPKMGCNANKDLVKHGLYTIAGDLINIEVEV